MKTRSLEAITRDLRTIGAADAQTICTLAYQLRDLDWAKGEKEVTEREAAMRRLLRDIVNKQANDVRLADIYAGPQPFPSSVLGGA